MKCKAGDYIVFKNFRDNHYGIAQIENFNKESDMYECNELFDLPNGKLHLFSLIKERIIGKIPYKNKALQFKLILDTIYDTEERGINAIKLNNKSRVELISRSYIKYPKKKLVRR